ncbi:Bcr/CflA family multidrug efflux MFS transporter [Paenibacillus sp. FSL H8-0537]|uniref:Bcr/CflA family multidrug efflux MFS transporter n=1 Tax=Paenibacillus sp. FSL H8-0537 TaxID=2921399 RepID=UPI003101B43A
MKQQVLISKQQPTSSARIRMALLLGALAAFAPLSIDMYLPALPELANYFGASASMAQLSLTACLLGIAVGQLIIGPLSDIYGRKKPLMIGLIVYVIASVLCIVAPSIETFVLLRLVQGLGGAAGIVLSRAIVRDMYDGPEMTKFFALLMLVNGVAPIAAPIAGGQVLQWTSWRGVFLVLGAIGVVMLFASWLGLRETLQEQNRLKGGLQSTLRTFGTLIRDRVFMGYALSQGFVTAAMFAYISGSPFVLQEIFGVSPQMFSVCFAINGVGIIIASQTAGRLAGKVSETKLLIVGLSMASIGGVALLLVILADLGLIAVLIPLFFVVSSVGVIQTASFTLAMQSQGKAAGSASALIGLLSFVIGAIAAPMVGLGGSHTALPMGIVIAASSIIAVLFYVFMARRGSVH